jgi:hypothetical protein
MSHVRAKPDGVRTALIRGRRHAQSIQAGRRDKVEEKLMDAMADAVHGVSTGWALPRPMKVV